MQPDGQPCTCSRTDTRLYAEGWRCLDHTPARRRGQPEPDTARYCAPNRCYCGSCPSAARPPDPITDTVVDLRAIASGKRRSSPVRHRDALAAVRSQTPR